MGLEGLRRARELTCKPLVAIGGITRANARSVIEAGADAVAVISDLLRDPRKSAEEFFQVLGKVRDCAYALDLAPELRSALQRAARAGRRCARRTIETVSVQDL